MTKDFYNSVYRVDHPSDYGGTPESMAPRVAQLRGETRRWLEQSGLSRRPEARILEIGCGMAYLADIHPGWHGAEYSKTAVERVKAGCGTDVKIFEADAQALPFENAAFDGVYTWAALEHVADPGKACAEIDRILAPGGFALIAPAWNCRPWTVKKLRDRGYQELGVGERLEKSLIPVREHILFRAAAALPGRLAAELRMLGGGAMPLRYRRLEPRWDLIERFGHVSDDDALADIDPHACVCFFKTRGYRVLSHPNMRARLMSRSEPVVVRKTQ